MNGFEFPNDGRVKSSSAVKYIETHGAFPSNGKLIEGAVRELYNERVNEKRSE